MTSPPSPADAARLDGLLDAWLRESAERGRGPAPEELCRDCPELLPRLRERLDAVRRVEALLPPGDSVAVTIDAPTPGGDEAPAVPAEHLPGYEILGEAGEGGMGVVYKARRVALNRVEAVKMIRAGRLAGPKERARFRFEAEAAAGLRHPNIVTLYDDGEASGAPYLAMQWVDGQSLAGRLAAGPLPPAAAAALVEKVARAVHFAHQHGLLHRDLKPGNILLDGAGEPYVTDFGIARRLDGSDRLTEPGVTVGTFKYMAPEQARAEPNLTVAADVYALGAVLYEALAGRPPFAGRNALELLRLVSETAPAPPRSVNPAVDPDLEAICLKCLEKAPADRYASAEELADDLARYRRREAVAARPPGFWDWLRQLARTRPEPNPHYSWQVTTWFGFLLLATCGAVYGLAGTGGPAIGVWAAHAACAAAMGGVLWWYMLRRFRRLPATEKHSLIIAVGHVAALLFLTAAYVPLSASAPAGAALAMYPPLAALSGLGLFTLGSTNWSRFFPIGLAMMALAPVLAAWPAASPLVYGAATAAVMWSWSYAKRGGFQLPGRASG
jgi:serine/threonine protein kinase